MSYNTTNNSIIRINLTVKEKSAWEPTGSERSEQNEKKLEKKLHGDQPESSLLLSIISLLIVNELNND